MDPEKPTPEELESGENAVSEGDPKRKVFAEEAKQRQVSHWDQDYLTREQLDEANQRTDRDDEGAA